MGICRHLGDNAQLEVIKNAGHAFNVEKPKEYYKLLKSFLVDSLPPPPSNLPAKQIKPTTILNI